MRTKELIKFTADFLDAKVGTVADHVATLQNAELIQKGTPGRFGGLDMTESDGVAAILAVTLDRPRGESAAAMVARLRSLPLSDARHNPLDTGAVIDQMRAAFRFVKGLSVHPLATLGDVLDGLVRDCLLYTSPSPRDRQ